MQIGIIKRNGSKFELHHGGKILARSSDRGYFEYHIAKGDVPKIVDADITAVKYEDGTAPSALLTPTASAIAAIANSAPEVPTFSIDERFEMMDELITMVVNGNNHKAMVIGGKGGIGKSFAVTSAFERMNKADSVVLQAEAKEKAKSIEIRVGDSKEDTEAKVAQLATLDSGKLGDYRIIKGYVSASALYRVLYENRHRVIVFDDCDSVLKDSDAVNVLKSALDTNEDRWVNWNVNGFGSDLPDCFKFEGQIIFITNMDMEKIPEPIMTRCLKVNMGMTPLQRITRMRSVLPQVMPEIDIDIKIEALDLIEKHVHVTKNVNFRALMQTIGIRIDPATKNWERLALFSLIEA